MSRELILPFPSALLGIADGLPALFTPHAKATERFFDFFVANIRNRNTRSSIVGAACCLSILTKWRINMKLLSWRVGAF